MAKQPVDRSKIELGRRGEQMALEWYLARGYTVLARNWRCTVGELDLVLTRSSCVVFCEVKTRSNERFGSPFVAITDVKARRLRQLAAIWLHEHRQFYPRRIRIDVAGVIGNVVEVRQGVV